MTDAEYETIQERLRLKLKERKPMNITGKRSESYDMGIKAAMSIIKECHERSKPKQ